MSCTQYQASIIALVLGELPLDEAEACREHVETCEACREMYESYACLVSSIEGRPIACPTSAESQALSRALAQVVPAGHTTGASHEPLPQGLPALVWGSVMAFVVVASVLSLQVWGCVNLISVARSIGPAPIALGIVITIFVTSFLPIAVAARRKPLNGMTFRR